MAQLHAPTAYGVLVAAALATLVALAAIHVQATTVCVEPFVWKTDCWQGCGQWWEFSNYCYDGPYYNAGNYTTRSLVPITSGHYQFAVGEINCCYGRRKSILRNSRRDPCTRH